MLLIPVAAWAAPGDLDPSFGNGGINLTSVGSRIDHNDYGRAVVRQSDGKIVVAGYSNNGSNDDFALVRYRDDGSLDTDFGGRNGIVTTPVGAFQDQAWSVIQQADGKLVVAGVTYNGGDFDFALVRYRDDGSLDTEFGGGDGIVTTPVGTFNDLARSVIQQADGKLVVAGYTQNGSSYQYALVRYRDDGSLDTEFGGGDGIVTTTVGTNDLAWSVIQQVDGKLVVAGYSNNGSDYDFALVRYGDDGSLDTEFGGGDGIVTTPVGASLDYGRSVIQQADGKLVVAGYSHSGSKYDFALVRYFDDGSLDTDFGGGDGIVTTPVGTSSDQAHSVIQQTDGKLVVAGASYSGGIYDFALVRYRDDGSLDTEFGGGDGIITTPVGTSSDQAHSMIQQTDGKLVVAGDSHNGSNYDFALVRFRDDGNLDTDFGGGDGTVTTPVGASQDQVTSAMQQADGKLVVAGYSNNGGDYDFALVRYRGDGSLDTDFGGDGTVTTPVGTSKDQAWSVIQQADGKVVIAGSSNDDFALVRYRDDGSLDADFGGDGIVTTSVGTPYDHAYSVIQQTDGKLVVAGDSFNGSNYEFALVRYREDGSLDTDFGGGDGIVTTPLGTYGLARSLIQQADGKLVAAGYSDNGGNYDFTLVRYNDDGSLDTAFGGGDGIVTTPVGASTDDAHSLMQQADGKLVVAGYSYNGSNYDFALVRYRDDGSLDTAFGGGDGIVTTPVGASQDQAYSVIQQADSKLVVAGYSNNGSNDSLVLARYQQDGSLDSSFGVGGKRIIETSYAARGQAVLQQSDGKLVVAGSSLRPQFFIVARVLSGEAPVAMPGGPYAINEGGSLVLDASASTDADGSIVSYDWDLDNDGDYSDASGVTVELGEQADDVAAYAIGLRVTDNEGNAGTASTTVTVSNVAPVAEDQSVTAAADTDNSITLSASDVAADTLGFAVAMQPANGSLSGTGVSLTYTPNPGFTGADSFTFTATDDDGGTSAPATVSITVIDQTAPVITLNGSPTITLEAGSTYSDPGGMASDNVDGDISASIQVSGSVDTGVVGLYTLTYSVSDTAGNAAATVQRTVSVVDTTPPVITLLGSSAVTLEVGGSYIDAGATATDSVDGDISGSIQVSGSVDTASVGRYTLTYSVSDAAGNAAVTLQRTVSVVDTTPPVITLLGSAAVTLEIASSYADAGASATDNVDGNISGSIQVSGSVDTGTVGVYTLTFSVSDAAGNAAVNVQRTVSVVDTTPPVITLLGSAAVTLEIGSSYTDAGATAEDNADGNISGSIQVSGSVDTGNVGVYTLTYSVSDAVGNAAANVQRTVSVVDTTPPVIALVGAATVTLEVGDNYTDAGATAVDNADGDISSSIQVVGSVDTSRIGEYVITYNVSDASGNAAATVQRTVSVVDTTPPVVTAPAATSIAATAAGDLSASSPAIANFLSGASAVDAVDGSVLVSNDAPAQFPIGSTSVTFTAEDASGNSASAQSMITISAVDQDFDGIPNDWEIEHGLDPDSDDSAADLDGDGRSNLEEYLQGGDPTKDDVAPVLAVPDDLTVASTGPLTEVDLGEATATDGKDGEVSTGVDNAGPFAPGAHTLTWSASDAAGNTATAQQQLMVLPQVSVTAAQSIAEGETATVELLLNGEAASYPVTVPYTVSGTAMVDADYVAFAGELVIESGTSGTFTIETLADAIREGRETIVLTLDAPTNAVLGGDVEQTITLLEENLAPEAAIVISQNDRIATTVAADGGAVEMLVDVRDANPDDAHEFDWSATDSNLVPTEGFASGSFTFAPGTLPAGLYQIALQVTDDGVPPLSVVTETLLRVIAQAPELSDSVDSDGDGLSDAEEGLEDVDMDRIPDYLDAHTDSSDSHLLAANTAGDLMQTAVGLHLRLGSTAYAAGHPYAQVSPGEIASFGGITGTEGANVIDEPMAYYAGIFDFEVTGLQSGASASVVVPQDKPLLSASEYRKYRAGQGWFDFVEDANNAISSAPGLPGICPAPGDAAYTPGITDGHHCIQVTIQDGGPNDADGVVNGTIKDPGGAAVDTSVAPQIQVQASMSDDLEISAGEEVVVLAFNISSDSDDAEIYQFTLAGSGSGNEVEDIGEAVLYLDLNGDGVPQVEEKISAATYEADDGRLVFKLPEPQQIPVGHSSYLVVYQFNTGE